MNRDQIEAVRVRLAERGTELDGDACAAISSLNAQIAEIERERDEAQKWRDHWQRQADQTDASWDAMVDERDQAQAQLAALRAADAAEALAIMHTAFAGSATTPAQQEAVAIAQRALAASEFSQATDAN